MSSKNGNGNTNKKKNVWFVIITLLMMKITIGYAIFKANTSPRTDDAYVYAETVAIAPEVSGRIIEMPVTDNQDVKKDDILFEIDPRPFKLTLEKAKNARIAIEKEIELAGRGIHAQEYSADAADKNVRNAKAATKQARVTLSRLEPLQKKGYVSKEQVDLARTNVSQAEAREAAAIASAKGARSSVTGTDAMMARLSAAKADEALAELELEFATVTAPFQGKVLGLRTTAGQFAASGHPVFTLADTRNWYVMANFRETDLKRVKKGASARIYLMSHTGRKFKAVVDSVSYGVHPDDGGMIVSGLPVVKRSINWVRVAQRFPVKFKVIDPDAELFRIGASAVVVITDEEAE